jgi:hypothetical protein
MTFAQLPPPTDEDVVALTRKVARRLTRVAQRYLGDDDDDDADCAQWHDPDDEQAARDHCLQAAIRAPVRPPPPSLPFIPSLPSPSPTTSSKPLCASVNGFSMHAATCVSQDDRDALERLCKYGLRAPIAQDRLSVLSDGRVRYELRKPWPTAHGATTELTFEPLKLMRRLAAIIPAPYTNMIRYYGCFANRSRFRARLPLTPEAQAQPSEHYPRKHTAAAITAAGQDDDALPQPALTPSDNNIIGGEPDADAPFSQMPAPRTCRTPWATLLKRAFGLDALRCECGAQMVVMAMITDVKVLEKILNHLKLPATPPPIATARMDPQEDLDLDLHHAPAEGGDAYLDESQHPHGRLAHHRAPP